MIRFTANLSMLFTERPLLDRFKAARQAGFNAVEIQFPYELEAETLRDTLAEQDLKLVLFNVDADDLLQGGEGLACVPEKQAQFKRAVEQTIRYAEILQPECINVLPGRCFNPDRLAEYQQNFVNNLSYAVQNFAPLGIKTVFEAINTEDMPEFIISTSQHMLNTLSHINHANLFMQYDIYHMHKMGENSAAFIQQYADQIGHIQFADCPGRHQPGTGEINFPELFTSIDKSNYTGWVGAEYKPAGVTETSLRWLNL